MSDLEKDNKRYVYYDEKSDQLSVWNDDQLTRRTGYKLDCDNFDSGEFVDKGTSRNWMETLGLVLVGEL